MSRVRFLAILGGLVCISTAVLFAWIFAGGGTNESEQLELGLRLVRRGDFETAAKLARTVQEPKIKKRLDKSTRHFLLGAAARQEADALYYRPSRTEKNEVAVEHLQQSREMKFPPGYEGQGNFLLGMALYDLFRWDEAIAPLSVAFDRWPKGRSDAVERLIDIDLYGAKRDPDAAWDRLERWAALSLQTQNDIDRISVKRMEILGERKEYDRIEPLWRAVPIDSPMRCNANLILARCLRQQARDSDPISAPSEKRERSLELLREIEFMKTVPTEIRRRTTFERGMIYRDSGALKQAVSAMSSLRLSSPFEPEFMIAGIEEIDALIDLKMYAETIATLEQLKKNFNNPTWYENVWMPLDRMRLRLLASANQLFETGVYAESSQFVENLPDLCTEVDRLRLEAVIHDRWARKMQQERSNPPASDSATSDPDEDEAKKIEGLYRRAARSIERLSQIDMRTPNYMERLWLGIEDFHRAGNFADSNRLIDRYLALSPRSDHSRVLLMQAKNFAAAGNVNAALGAIDRLLLMDPENPLVPDAKLTAAKLQWNRGNFDAAEALILDNLYSGRLRPDSAVWKESLIELGTLMFRQGERVQVRVLGMAVEDNVQPETLQGDLEKSYEQLLRSIASMEEGLRRFQGDARRYQLLYMTAKAYRMASYWPEALLQGNRLVSEESISEWKSKRAELLVNSRNTFASLRRELTSDQEKKAVPNSEVLLCNSYFGEADLLFQEGNFNGALEAYRNAANQFINEPESLEAFVQMARCYQELGRTQDMRRTLEMAIDVLGRIPADRDGRFQKNTSGNRQSWDSKIRWMIDEIDQGSIR